MVHGIQGDKIGMFDPVTKEFSEYEPGIPGGHPYFIRIDKYDNVWFNVLNGNYMVTFDPQTKKLVFYLQPSLDGFGRDGWMDYSTNPPAIVFGSALYPKITRMYVREAK